MATWEEERGPNYLSQHCASLDCKWCRERRERRLRAATVVNMEEAARRFFDPWEMKIGPRNVRQVGDVAVNWNGPMTTQVETDVDDYGSEYYMGRTHCQECENEEKAAQNL